jgi:FixJ family two-component response regulator
MLSKVTEGSNKKNSMISVIEDDSSVRESIEILLQSVGMECQSFACAEQFLAEFIPCLEDIIVLDLNLPGISGCDLLQTIDFQANKIQIIVTTAFDDPVSRELCRQYGVLAYLRKPVDGMALIDIIRYSLTMSTIDNNKRDKIKIS